MIYLAISKHWIVQLDTSRHSLTHFRMSLLFYNWTIISTPNSYKEMASIMTMQGCLDEQLISNSFIVLWGKDNSNNYCTTY